MRWQPDPTFYPSPKMAMEAPAERLAYVAMLNPTLKGRPDAMGVVDVDPGSKSYGKMVGRVDMPNAGKRSVLSTMETAARWILGTGEMNLTGYTPNGHVFAGIPRLIWSIAGSRATIRGVDAGAPAPLPKQAMLGDFRVPLWIPKNPSGLKMLVLATVRESSSFPR